MENRYENSFEDNKMYVLSSIEEYSNIEDFINKYYILEKDDTVESVWKTVEEEFENVGTLDENCTHDEIMNLITIFMVNEDLDLMLDTFINDIATENDLATMTISQLVTYYVDLYDFFLIENTLYKPKSLTW